MKRFLRYGAWGAAMLLLLVCPMQVLAAEEALPDKVGAGPRPTSPDTLDQGGTTQGGKTTIAIYNIGRRYFTLKFVDEEPKNPENPESLPDIAVTLSPPGTAAVNLPAEAGEAIPINGNYPALKAGRYMIKEGEERFKSSLQPEQYDVKYIADSPEFQPQAAPLILGLTDRNKYNQVEIRLKPKHIPVRYHASWPGMIPPGVIPPKEKTEEVRWGTGPKAPLTDLVPQGRPYAFAYWTKNEPNGERVDGLNSLKLEGDDLVRSGIDLYAHYSRQYAVRYEAGKYGYLEGSPFEMVTAGKTPGAVPMPVPLSSRDYWFVRWQLAGSSREIDPSQVIIKGDTTFEAVFDVRKPQPVIVRTPPAGPGPAAPEWEGAAGIPDAPSQEGVGEKAGESHGESGGGSRKVRGAEEASKQWGGESQGEGNREGNGESNGKIPSLSSPSQAGASGQKGPPSMPRPEGGDPVRSKEHSSEPVFGPGKSDMQRQLQWLILLCCLLTLLAGWRRLVVIHRFLLHQGKEGEKTRPTSMKAVTAEAAVGLICAALWGTFFVMSTSPWSVVFLALWGIMLLTLSGLIIHGEYRMRHRAD